MREEMARMYAEAQAVAWEELRKQEARDVGCPPPSFTEILAATKFLSRSPEERLEMLWRATLWANSVYLPITAPLDLGDGTVVVYPGVENGPLGAWMELSDQLIASFPEGWTAPANVVAQHIADVERLQKLAETTIRAIDLVALPGPPSTPSEDAGEK